MTRYCKHCGSFLDEDAKVCDFCGTVLEIPQAEAPQPEQPVDTPTPAPKKWLTKKKLLIAGGVLLAIVLVAVAVYFLCFGHYYAVHKYESVMNGNFKQLKTLAPTEYWEYLAKKKGVSVNDYIDDGIESLQKRWDDTQSALEEIYGDNYHIILTVVDSEALDADIFSKLKDALKEDYNISPSRVGSARTLILKVHGEGSKLDYTNASVVYAIQIDAQWYLIRYSMSNDVYKVSFIVSGSSSSLIY